MLEDRTLLDNGQWLVVINGLTPAPSLAAQVRVGANLLHSVGLQDQDVTILQALDLSGTFVVQTPVSVTEPILTSELQRIPGFNFVQDYDPDAGGEVDDEEDGDLIDMDYYEETFGPFDYKTFLQREANGPLGGQGGPVTTPPAPADVRTNNNNGATGTAFFTQSETTVLAFGNTVLVGFNDAGSNAGGTNKFTGFARSTDGGLTFTDGGTLPTNSNGDLGDPVLARSDSTGRIFFATLQFTNGGIAVFHSDDNGLTWSAPVQGAPGKTAGGSVSQDKEWIAVDNFSGAGNGNVYLVERDFGPGNGIYFFSSTDNGNTFGPSGGTLIATGNQGAYVTVGPDHSVYVFWWAGSTLQMRKSTNQGVSFGSPVTVATGLIGGTNGDLGLTGVRQGTTTAASFRSDEFPRAVVNPVTGNVYVTYANKGAGSDKADIFFVQSTNGGTTWSAPVKVNDDTTTTDQWQPALVVTPDGTRLGIFYYSRQEDPANNLFKYYGRIGVINGSSVTFMPSFAVSDTPSLPEFSRDAVVNPTYMGDYDTAFATPGAFHVTWTDNRDDLPGGGGRKDPNVYYKRIDVGLTVTSTIPAVGSVVFAQPTVFTVNLTDAVNLATLNASDFQVNGIPATSVTYTPGSTTITFGFVSTPVTNQGLQTMHIDAGAFTRANDGNPVIVFNGTFRYDAILLQVVSTNPAFPGGVFTLPGPFTYDVTFNEPVDPTSLQTSDLVLSGVAGATVTGVTVLPGNTTARFTINTILEGTLSASIAVGAITDAFGNPGAAFSSTYVVDFGTVSFPVALTSRQPQGSLISDGTVPGAISPATDIDSFTLSLDPNQTLTLAVRPTSTTLRPIVEIRDPAGTLIGSATAAAAGQPALLQLLPITRAGTYTITVRSAAGTSGGYTLQVLRNAGLENETEGGPTNDTRATAQSLESSFLNLGGDAGRAAVLGTADLARVPLPTEIEPNNTLATANEASVNFRTFTGNLYHLGLSGNITTAGDNDWFNIGTLDVGDIITVSLSGAPSSRGTLYDPFLHLYRGAAASPIEVTSNDDGGPRLNGADSLIYRFRITVADTYYIRARDFMNPGSPQTGTYQLGLLLENTGPAPGTGGNVVSETEPNDSALTATNASNSWRAVQYQSLTTATISPANESDFYQFQLTAGDLITINARSTSTLDARVNLYNASGTVIALENGTSVGPGGDSPLYAFRIPTSGFYFVQVLGSSTTTTGTYTLEVDLSTTASLPSVVPGEDYYAFTLAAGESATLALRQLSTTGNLGFFRLQDATGTTLALGRMPAGTSNLTQVISDFIAPTSGTYYAVITGSVGTQYNLLVTRNAAFDIEPNNSYLASPAQQLLLSPGRQQTALGYIGDTLGSDIYELEAIAGQSVQVQTDTPSGGPGALANNLNPLIRVYAPDGHLLAEDDDSAADHRNASLRFTAETNGLYFIEVLPTPVGSATQGEYVLTVTGGSSDLPVFEVTATNPLPHSFLNVAPTTLTVTFPENLLLTSLQASDLIVDGRPATNFTLVNGSQVQFTLPTGLPEGAVSVRIPAGALLDTQGRPLAEYNDVFYLDRVAPRVIFSSLSEGDVVPTGSLTYVVGFDEPLNAAVLDPTDFTLLGVGLNRSYTPASFTYIQDTSVLTIRYANLPEDSYRLTLLSGTNNFRDLAGNLLDGEPPAGLWHIPPQRSGNGVAGGNFVVNFVTDLDTAPFPAALVSAAPPGSLIYQGQVPGLIHVASDTDSYTLALDPGQTLTLLVAPTSSGLRPSVQLRGPSGAVLGSATAAAAGQNALLQTLTVATSGVYTITVSSAGGTSGGYSVQVLLNAARENEGTLAGVSNNTLATAQDLNASFVTLQTSLATTQRGAVMGVTDSTNYTAAAIPFVFEDISGTGTVITGLTNQDDASVSIPIGFTFQFYGANNTTVFVSSNGLLTFGSGSTAASNSDLTASPTQAAIAPFWDDLHTGGGVTGSNVFYQVLGTGANQHLTIQWNKIRFFSGGSTGDTLTFEAQLYADGRIQFNYQDLVSGSATGNNGASATAGLKGTGTQGLNRLLLAFNNGPNNFVGTGQSTLLSPPPVAPDYYSFTLAAGQMTTVAVTGLSAGNLNLELRNSNDVTLATGVSGPTNLTKVISQFVAAAAGTYYVRITGENNIPYSVLVTRDTTFEKENNNTFATAQSLDGTRGVLGLADAGILYGATRAGQLFTIDLATGAGALVGLLPITTTEIEYDNLSRRAFAQAPDGGFYGQEFDITTGAGIGGAISNGAGFTGMEWVGSTLYATAITGPGGGSTLRTLNPFTGTSTIIGSTGFGPISGLAYDESSGILYGITGGATGNLLRINLTTGAATLVGPTGFQAGSLEFGPDGLLYGGGTGLDESKLFRINPATGTSVLVGMTGIGVVGAGDITGLALVSTSGDDWYSITLGSDQTLRLETSTPADGAGEFSNTLDPHIELYGPSGQLIAVGTAESDGRNEYLEFTVPAGMIGVYRIRVSAENGTRGEYFLTPLVSSSSSLGSPFISRGTSADHSDGAAFPVTVATSTQGTPISSAEASDWRVPIVWAGMDTKAMPATGDRFTTFTPIADRISPEGGEEFSDSAHGVGQALEIVEPLRGVEEAALDKVFAEELGLAWEAEEEMSGLRFGKRF